MPKQQPKRFWNWAEATVVGFLALIGIDVVLGLLLGLVAGVAERFDIAKQLFSSESVVLQFSMFTLSRLLGLGLVFGFIKRRGISLRMFGFKRFPPFKSVGLIFGALVSLFATSGLVFYITQRILPDLNLEQEQEVVFTAARNYPELLMGFVALVIIAPIVEEVIFRGLLLPAYSRRFGIIAATSVTSVLFGLVHGQLNVGIITFIMGLLLAGLYYKTRSLWPAIIFHSLKNLIAFILIFNLPT